MLIRFALYLTDFDFFLRDSELRPNSTLKSVALTIGLMFLFEKCLATKAKPRRGEILQPGAAPREYDKEIFSPERADYEKNNILKYALSGLNVLGEPPQGFAPGCNILPLRGFSFCGFRPEFRIRIDGMPKDFQDILHIFYHPAHPDS